MSLFSLRALGRRGVAAAELALLAPVLVMLLLAVHDVANAMQISIRLERAARAGAQYAVANSSDLTAVRNAVIAAWPALTGNDVPLPVLACQCAATPVACTASCPSGLVQTITVRATRSLSPLLLTSRSEGVGHAVVRLQ